MSCNCSEGLTLSGGAPRKTRASKSSKPAKKVEAKKPSYEKTKKTYTDRKGVKHVVYKKGEKCYIKKLSKTSGKFVYRSVTV